MGISARKLLDFSAVCMVGVGMNQLRYEEGADGREIRFCFSPVLAGTNTRSIGMVDEFLTKEFLLE